ncbi:TPA: recombinase family protein [Listeria monocytogenes]|uniref:recombinase family protein n=1 Tax=Listeria monocytogenes TaxID=1639 RepID=UPI000985C1F2|nr:recombinase family protein [Listeria monocytogenes]EAC4489591.1 recombinase family protein [Listeria monocytogenes]EAC4490394.1 recombinase family protein [Listeria monocytogenes]EAE4845215.1 recombinase family protein [Listeria monocytogenes]EAE4846145.1 recombinase family protein [Listeria monocytogenes]EAG7002975.1 recombinase family protein [Listeria monocytogenes]
MKKITKIDNVAQVKPAKLKVAAYARVSTSSEEQLLSLENQKLHYEQRILANSNWEFVEMYFDEGISGTKIDKRNGLKRLLQDCETGKVDFILTKSISRFSRNALDCLEIVRRLIDLNIFIEFEKENINTQTMDGELMLSILSSLAESESRSLSQNTKWSIEKRFQNGTYKIGYPPFGYDWVDGVMVINKEQAVVVRDIFADVLKGTSTGDIAEKLNQQGVTTKRRKTWHGTTIRGIIKNEKYIGDALFGKTFTDDSFKRKVNRGDKNQYFMEGHHSAIIDKETFEQAQQMLVQNAKSKNIVQDDDKYQNRYSFSGVLKCGECGGIFKRRIQSKNKNEKYVAWACTTHLKDKHSCSMKFIKDEQIKLAFITMMNKLVFFHQILLKPLLADVRSTTYTVDNTQIVVLDDELEKLKQQQDNLVQFVANGYIDRLTFVKEQNQLTKQMDDLENKRKMLTGSISKGFDNLESLEELVKLTKQGQMLTAFEDSQFDSFVDEVVILSRTELVFKLKCGLKLKERLV